MPVKPQTPKSSGQPTLASFFNKPPATPSSAKALDKGKGRAPAADVIELLDSSDDELEATPVARKGETDEQMARRLAGEEQARVGSGVGSSSSAKKRKLDQAGLESDESVAGPSSTTRTTSAQLPAARTPKKERTTAFGLKSAAASSVSSVPVFPDLDVDPLLFQPEAVDVSAWPGGRVPYAFVVLTGFVPVAATRKRLAKIRILTNLFRTITHHDPPSLLPTLYLLSNSIGPSYESNELGIGSQILSAALKSVTGLSQAALRKLSDKLGDAGDVAFEAKVNVRTLIQPTPLIVHRVYESLVRLSVMKGTGVQKTKGDIVQKLLVSAKGEEVRFLVRGLIQNLRIGAVRQTLLASLAKAFTLTRPPSTGPPQETTFFLPRADLEGLQAIEEKPLLTGKGKVRALPPDAHSAAIRGAWRVTSAEAEKLMRRVYVRHPNYSDIVPALLSSGLEGLEQQVRLTVGIPLSPMLGSITRSLAEVFERLSGVEFTSEAKLDGQRGQIHVRAVRDATEEKLVRQEVGSGGLWTALDDGRRVFCRLFSRHSEDMTEKYPDIISLVKILLARPMPTLDSAAAPTPADPPLAALFQADRIDSFIFDCEIVALDKPTGAFRPFQELAGRAKKDVRIEDVKVEVGLFAFDLMLLNDQILLGESLRVRRHLLRSLVPPFNPPVNSPTLVARFDHIQSIDSTDAEEVSAFFQEVVKNKAEGLMIKLLDGIGTAGDGFDEDAAMESVGKSALKRLKRRAREEPKDDDDDEYDEAALTPPEPLVNVKEGGAGDKGESELSSEEELVPIATVAVANSSPTKAGRKKDLPATYQPDVRSLGWLKVKKDYIEGGVGDSLDLVPIGAWHGSGRKAGWWSPILLACYNSDSGELEALCKCMSGFSDAFYKANRERYDPQAHPDDCWPAKGAPVPAGIETNGRIPDVWFAPSEVWEIRGADITLSPVYPAGMASLGGERGLSLRFPRFMKVRDDKGTEQATSSEEFARMYRAQEGDDKGGVDDDWEM